MAPALGGAGVLARPGDGHGALINNAISTPEKAVRLEAALGIMAEAWTDLKQHDELWYLRE
jgi:plasmid maintenance system antidote protein VapI